MDSGKLHIPSVRMLPEDLANKIAAGEVVERPASVVKELIENSLDAWATSVSVRIVAAGRRSIEVTDNGHGMSEQDALLSIERHATSKIRKAEDLDNIRTMGFRGEALASIGAVSRMELVTRRAQDEAGTLVRVDGGVLRDVSRAPSPVGTRISVNHLYFNTPARAKFLKGVTTELSHCIDTVQRHLLARSGVEFKLLHNDRMLLEIPEKADLRQRAALIWGLNFAREMAELDVELGGFRLHGLLGMPGLTRSQRSHQFFFLNTRPVINRALQYGLEDGYRGLLTIGRYPVAILMIDAPPRYVDVNIHPAKREIRFRDERATRDIVREAVRTRLEMLREPVSVHVPTAIRTVQDQPAFRPAPPEESYGEYDAVLPDETAYEVVDVPEVIERDTGTIFDNSEQQNLDFAEQENRRDEAPKAMYAPVGTLDNAPLQLFDTYLLIPEEDRLLIIDQHALHERLTYDALRRELEDSDYASQQLAVPILIDVPPSHVRVLEAGMSVFSKLGLELEAFGGNTFQVTAICHLYDESKVPDTVFRILDKMAQGEFFDRGDFVAEMLRLSVEACRSSVKAGDRLSQQERRELLDGFRRLRPPYTCPHGRPIITELTQVQMEKSFRRRQ